VLPVDVIQAGALDVAGCPAGPYAEAEWHDATVIVERGQVELGARDGGRRPMY
jgi:hypothetical protein